MLNHIKACMILFSLFGLFLCSPVLLAEDESPNNDEEKKMSAQEPDYTKGEKPSGLPEEYWELGPLGAGAYIWESKGREPTRNTRMMLIKQTTEGTPAHGALLAGDVILGVVSPVSGPTKNDARFTTDARMALAAAITSAETKEHKGKLVLNIWRKGKAQPVTITLPLKGSFSATSPWDCEKTNTLIDEAAAVIVKKGFTHVGRKGDESITMGVQDLFDALGLLATGEDKYMPVLKEYAKAVANRCERLDIFSSEEGSGMGTWQAAYCNLFLTEYFLITKDEAVLPGITAMSMYLSQGQSGVGTWSHGMAAVKVNGLYGPPCAYGSMNAASIPCGISLMLAQKCGFKKPEIDDAVERTLTFFRWYVHKGVIPYGDHTPKDDKHDGNGKCSMAAVMYDIAGDSEAADFFTRMTLASYHEREAGHTGPYFGLVWGPLGAARGGPEAAHAFIEKTRWFIELERRSNGAYVHQLPLGKKYKHWSTSGCRLLQLCLSRKALYITGKSESCVKPIVSTELKSVMDAAEFDPVKLSTKDLLASLSSWSPVVRNEAAMELGSREENVVKELIEMLDGSNKYARFGACNGLKFAGRQSKEAVDLLVEKLKNDKDIDMRFFMVNALKIPSKKYATDKNLGEIVRGSTNELLKLAATYEPEADPQRKLHREIAGVLFGDGGETVAYFPGAKGATEIDRSLLIPALKSWLKNPNGEARTNASIAYKLLSESDLQQLWGDIYYSVKKPAPSGVMFAVGGRVNGVKVMADHHIKEGVEAGVNYVVRTEGWGAFKRQPGGIIALQAYGQALKEYFPEIEALVNKQVKKLGPKKSKGLVAAYEFMKKTPAPVLTSIEQQIKAYEKENSVK